MIPRMITAISKKEMMLKINSLKPFAVYNSMFSFKIKNNTLEYEI